MGRNRWIVGSALLGWTALAFGIVEIFPRARAEIVIGYLPVAAAIVWLARGREGRRWSWPMRILAALAVTAVCACGPFVFFAFNEDPFMPSSDELLPLPPGLHATDHTGDSSDFCGTGACIRRFSVSGEPGLPAADIRDRVGRHLHERGWTLGADGQDCRPAGWLLDRTTLCVMVYVHEGVVYVAFEGARAWA